MLRSPRLSLELFGGPTLLRGEHHVGISPFQAGLLAIVFTEGKDRLPRAFVQDLLWNDSDERAVRHRLSQLVYQTNRRCEAKVVQIEGEAVRVHGGIVGCDLDDFEEMIRAPRFKEACELLERGFLTAFPSQRTDALGDWMERQRLRIRARLREKAIAAWAAAEASQDWARARPAAEVLLALDPRDEVVLRRVMRARAMGGLVREAEAIYLAFAERARPGKPWSPQAETRDLLASVRASFRRPEAGPDSPTPLELDVPFRGRDQELAYLTRSIFQKREDGQRITVTISGEAGLGKTRLVEEAIQGARFRGYRVLRARPAELERSIPLNPLLEGLNQPWVGPILRSLDDPWRSVLLSLLPQFHEGPGPLPEVPYVQPGSLPRRTCEALFRLFSGIAEEQRTLFFLDDFHWADEASVSVLQFLHRRWRRGAFTLLLNLREEELTRGEAASRFVRELELDPEVTTMHLDELEVAAAKALAGSVAPDRLSDSVLDEIVGVAGGNPFFLIELTADYLADRAPGRRLDGMPVPFSVRHMIRGRMAELDPISRKVISGLAVFGHIATLGKVTQITGRSREECVDALERLQHLRLVKWSDVGVRTRHDIVRRSVYEDLSPARRAMLHAATAEMLLAGSTDPPLDQLALHYYRAGERELALRYALEAVEGAESGGAIDRLHLLQVAYEVSDGPRRPPVAVRLAQAHYESRQLASALRFGEEALAGRAHLTLPETLAVRLVVADSRRLLGRDAPDVTLEELSQLERKALEAGEEALVAKVLDTTLNVLDRSGKTEAAAALLSRLVDRAPFADTGAQCRLLCTLSLQVLYGNPGQGLVASRRAVGMAREPSLAQERMMCLHRHLFALIQMGLQSTGEGQHVAREAMLVSGETGDRFSQVLMRLNLVAWHTTVGERERAWELLEEVAPLMKESDSTFLRFLECVNRGNLNRLSGRFGAAREDFQTASNLGLAGVPEHHQRCLAAMHGQTMLELGRLKEARALSGDCPLATKWTHDYTEPFLFHARLLVRTGDHVRARQVLHRGMELSLPRMKVPWLRLARELIRLTRRRRQGPCVELAEKATRLARELDLTQMELGLRAFLQ